MIQVHCIEIGTHRKFVQEFSNVCDTRRYLIKCQYSNKVMIEAVYCDTQEESEYLADYY